MNIEMFSRSKYKSCKFPGDDIVLLQPDLVMAVFDGATDATGAIYQGETSGRIAARAAARRVSELAQAGELGEMVAQMLFDAVNQRIAEVAAERGLASPPSTTAAIVADLGTAYRVLVFGDSGVRVNGKDIYRQHKRIDDVSTYARIATHKLLGPRVGDADAAEAATRRTIFLGFTEAKANGVLSADEAEAILADTAVATGVERAAVDEFLLGGIKIQFRYANHLAKLLGYTTLNGTPIPDCDMIDVTLPKADVLSVEIFTDGYLSLPSSGQSVADWEREFARIEAEDFAKTGSFRAVKGSTSQEFCDDRSVICLTHM